MAYTTQQLIQTEIPAPHLVDALDDDGDGQADPALLDAIIASASQAVDAFLAAMYDVPFADPAPATVREAAFAFACERIYDRRVQKGTGGDNPWRARANQWRDHLKEVVKGTLALDAQFTRDFTPGRAITEIPAVDTSMR